MNKAEFTQQLQTSLIGLSQEDINRSVDYYTEMIDDRVEDGMTEEDAVAALGSIAEIRSKILEEVPITKIVKEKITPKRSFSAGEIILLVLGFPLWLPLLLTAIIVGLVLYMTFWIIILSLYVVDFSVFISGIASIIVAIVQPAGFFQGMWFAGCGIAAIGIAILLFFGFNQITKGMLFLSKRIGLGIKKLFVGGRTDET
ncbi:DUF1700 domain-containing protein [Butyrivibrio sp. CB08]|uniref:DUF1700 domain-containing protein n=1 Tax=Butyrivibrio sp. CB08 TaxID=2364879 RepID=UPI000EAA0ED8|nr:DUF1700 domain-containing protein [Butyrivibrio sp. CB08]RKM59291.1 DUF1700 domain-containing protein [Butyrivibrio sp. CB08]